MRQKIAILCLLAFLWQSIPGPVFAVDIFGRKAAAGTAGITPDGINSRQEGDATIWLDGTINSPVKISSGKIVITGPVQMAGSGSLTLAGGRLIIEESGVIDGNMSLIQKGELINNGAINGTLTSDGDVLPARLDKNKRTYTPSNVSNYGKGIIQSLVMKDGHAINASLINNVEVHAGTFENWTGKIGYAVVYGGAINVGNGGWIDDVDIRKDGRLFIGNEGTDENGDSHIAASVGRITLNADNTNDFNIFNAGSASEIKVLSGHAGICGSVGFLNVSGGKADLWNDKAYNKSANYNCSAGSIVVSNGILAATDCKITSLDIEGGKAEVSKTTIGNVIVTGSGRFTAGKSSSIDRLYTNGSHVPRTEENPFNVNLYETTKTKEIVVVGDSKVENGGDAGTVTIDCNFDKEKQASLDETKIDQHYVTYGSTARIFQHNGHTFVNGSVDEIYIAEGNLFNHVNGHIKTLYKTDSEEIVKGAGKIDTTGSFSYSDWMQKHTIPEANVNLSEKVSGAVSRETAIQLPEGSFHADKTSRSDLWFKVACDENSTITASFQAPDGSGCLVVQDASGRFQCAPATGGHSTLTLTTGASGNCFIRVIGGRFGFNLKTSVAKPSKISYTLTKQYAVMEGSAPRIDSADIGSYQFQLTNVSGGNIIKDADIRSGRIYLPSSQAGAGDRLRITLTSLSKDTVALEKEFVLNADNSADIKLDTIQKGYIQASFSDLGDINGFLFNSEGSLVQSLVPDGCSLASGKLEPGSYHAVFIRGSQNLWKLSNLADYGTFGLKEGENYIKWDVNVKNGAIVSPGNINVPALPKNTARALDGSETSYTSSVEITPPGKLVTMRLAYRFNNTYSNNVKNIKAVFDIPDGAEFVKESLTVDGEVQNISVDSDSRLTVPLEGTAGVILFCIRPDGSNPFISSTASFRYSSGGSELAELAGSVSLEVPVVSITGPKNTSSEKVNVSGTGIPGAKVTIHDGTGKIGDANCNKAGVWEASVTLSNTQDKSVHNLTARLYTGTKKETSSEALEVTYDKSMVDVTELAIYYNAHTPQKIVLDKEMLGIARPRLSLYPGTPFTFTIKATNTERVDKLYVVSTRNGERKRLEAFYDATKALWTASGHFDEENKDYLPGALSIEYIPKDEKPAEITLAELKSVTEGSTPKAWENAEPASIESTFANNSEDGRFKVSFNTGNKEKSKLDMLLEVKHKPADKTPEELVAEGYQQFDPGDGSLGFIRITADANTCTIRTEYTRLYKKNSKAASAGTFNTGFPFGTAAIATGLATNPVQTVAAGNDKSYGEYFMENITSEACGTNESQIREMKIGEQVNKAIDRVLDLQELKSRLDKFEPYQEALEKTYNKMDSQPNMTDAQKQYYKKLIMQKEESLSCCAFFELEWYYCYKRLEGLIGGKLTKFPGLKDKLDKVKPLTDTLNKALGKAALDKTGDKKIKEAEDLLKEIENPPLIIATSDPLYSYDPSGYVYEAVPSNRLEGVKASAYYRKDGKAVIWDAHEYNQSNPLYTDRDGKYAWDVPEGQWQVMYELKDYETARSDWLPVPPPQTEVNVGMVSKAAPIVEWANLYEPYLEIKFSKYMKPDTVTAENITLTDKNGKPAAFRVEAANDEAAGDGSGTKLASVYRLVFDNIKPSEGAVFKLSINEKPLSYAGSSLKAYSGELSCRHLFTEIKTGGSITVKPGQTFEVPVSLGPDGNPGDLKLSCTSHQNDFCKVLSVSDLDRHGKAKIKLQALLPGEITLNVKLEKTSLASEIKINISNDAAKAAFLTSESGSNLFGRLWFKIVLAAAGVILVSGLIFITRRKGTKEN